MTSIRERGALEVDRNGFVVLDRATCIDLAGSARLGRLSLTRKALPLILPVAFALLDGVPVFRVGPGAILEAARGSSVCCFEVDGAGDDWSWAWSVSMIGPVTLLDEPDLLARADRLSLPTWSGAAAAGRYARIDPAIMSGRWLS